MLLGTQEHIEVWELLPEGGAERATSGTQKHITLRERLSYSRHPEGDYCPGATHQADSQSLAARTNATLASLFDDVVQERHLAEQKAHPAIPAPKRILLPVLEDLRAVGAEAYAEWIKLMSDTLLTFGGQALTEDQLETALQRFEQILADEEQLVADEETAEFYQTWW